MKVESPKRPTAAELMRRLSIALAVLILIGFWGISAYISVLNNQYIRVPGYVDSPERTTPLSHDISLIFKVRSFDPSTGKTVLTLHIAAWLPPNYTEMYVHVFGNNFTDYVGLLRPAGQGYGTVVFLQTNATQEGPFTDVASGLSQRFPYDQYFLFYQMNFGPFLNQTFQSGFVPNIFFEPTLGWHAVVTENSHQTGNGLDVQVRIALFRDSVNSLQFFVPAVAVYLVLGVSMFLNKSSRREEDLTPLIARSIMYLAMVAAAFTLITSFVPTGTGPTSFSFLQATYISLLLATMVILAFSILDKFLPSSKLGEFPMWDFRALLVASSIPVFYEFGYSFLSILPYAKYFYQLTALDLLKYGFYYLDYRIPLWFVMIFAVLWIAFFQRNKLTELPFLIAGLGGIILLSTSEIPQIDIGLASISTLYAIIGVGLAVTRIARWLRKAAVARTSQG